MNGLHDMGGVDGFGSVEPEPDEPVFHEEWEARVFALSRAMGYVGLWNLDMVRAGQEAFSPSNYLSFSYFKRWALGLEDLLVEHQLVTREEIAAGRMLRTGKQLARKLSASAVPAMTVRPSFARPAPAPARFTVGDRVRTANMHPPTHTRLPRYARGRFGVIDRVHGCHVYPDSAAIRRGENPQWLYTVLFEGRELWGEDSSPRLKVSIEAFEPYLEPAGDSV